MRHGSARVVLNCRSRDNRAACTRKPHRTRAPLPSAKKAARKIARRTEINRTRKSRMRTFVRKVEEAIASGDRAAAAAALQ
ncbi:MAG: 30S ribosomal protein S20, partial [Pseudomonadota bacterium]|nr:30S ribosomal protein S20 [Pseudomonadota bacterium]